MTYIPVGAQNEVITTTASVSVVLGGAGTGKTITASAAAAAHIRARDSAREQQRRKLITDGQAIALPPKARVLFMSFSRTAVAQVSCGYMAAQPRVVAKLPVCDEHLHDSR
jgi:DNA helicase-2/ATP-dependent DNA helicase PcrA